MKEFPLSLSRQKSFCLRLKGIWLIALLLHTPLLAQNEGKKDGDKFKDIQELEQRLEKTATKMLRLANKVAAGIRSEIREYRKDIIECCPEVLVVRDSLKVQAKRGLEHCRREMHRVSGKDLEASHSTRTKNELFAISILKMLTLQSTYTTN